MGSLPCQSEQTDSLVSTKIITETIRQTKEQKQIECIETLIEFSNGKKINLDNVISSQKVKLGNLKAIVTPGNNILYSILDNKIFSIAEDIYRTGSVSNCHIKLIENSEVSVNQNSQIKISSGWDQRKITLVDCGDIELNVSQNGSNPFVVSVNGTDFFSSNGKFRVKFRNGNVEVSLQEGIVWTVGSRSNLVLIPGQRFVIEKGFSISVEDTVSYDKRFEIEKLFDQVRVKKDRSALANKKISLIDILHWIERRYDVELNVQYNLISPDIYTGTSLRKKYKVKQVLDILQEAGLLSYTKTAIGKFNLYKPVNRYGYLLYEN